MRHRLCWGVLVLGLVAGASTAKAGTRRFALVVASNQGGRDRATLRYAVRDAQSIVRVLTDIGGVADDDLVLLVEPTPKSIREALQTMKVRARTVAEGSIRVEFVFYYSGHSDEDGLLLGEEKLTYRALRSRIDEVAADVRLGIIDSCAAGALTRMKGGIKRPPFLIDESSTVAGYAFLASSSENEVAQESDRIEASFFTHSLVTGLRGAADASGDGRVTLNEAYQFAFHETLERTESTRGGPQHATYDIQLVGSGDFVVTDLRAVSARIAFSKTLEGRISVRDQERRLIAELIKTSGRVVELGLEPGLYDISVRLADNPAGSAGVRVTLEDGSRQIVHPEDLESRELQRTRRRGRDAEAKPTADHVPLNISFLPGLSINGGRRTKNNLSLGVLWDRTTLVEGLAGSSLVSVNDETLKGVQVAGLVSYVGEQLTGLQAGGLGAILAGAGRGAQAGAVFNYAVELIGLQATGVFNFAHSLQGLQVGVVSFGGEVTGGQISIINIAGRVRGFQLGIFNFAREVKGAPIGLVSYVSEGRKNLTFWATDTGLVSGSVQIGGEQVYSLIAFSSVAVANAEAFGLGFGVGVAGEFDDHWGLHVRGIVFAMQDRWTFARPPNLLTQIQLLSLYELNDSFAFYIGPTFNIIVPTDGGNGVPNLAPAYAADIGKLSRAWPALLVGVQLF